MTMTPFDGGITCWALFGGAVVAGGCLAAHGARFGSPVLASLGALVAAGALAWAASPAWAADDPAALVRQAQARGRGAEAALREWVAEVAERGQAYEAEARALAHGNAARLKQGFSYLEAGDLFGSAVDGGPFGHAREAGVVYVAVSFSMEPAALRALAEEARRAGAVMVVRGFIGGSVGKTLARARTAFDESAGSGLAIDPQVFRAFHITRVPAFIAAAAPVQPCEGGIDCTSPAPSHDRLAGNITLTEALRLLAAKGQDAPEVARSALARMER